MANSDIITSVQQLYVAYFNRPADVGGLNYWASVVAAQGGSTAAVSAAFAKSAEYTAAFANKSSFEVVDQIYQNLFGRHAELGGLGYWGLLLDQKKITIDNAVTQIAAGAQGSDAIAYGNKVAASGLFTTALDSANSALAYLGAAAAQSAKDYITSITDAASFADKTTPAAISTAVANLVAAHEGESNAPQIKYLTTGIDSEGFVPSSTQKLAGNDTFYAYGTIVAGKASQTLTSFDTIDGGAGTNTFKVISAVGTTDAPDLTLPTTASVKNFQNAEITGDAVVSGDVSGWTGLTKLTASSVGGVNLTAAATTAVTFTGTGGAAGETITGGAAVIANIATASLGNINISKGTGALTFTHAGGGGGTTKLDSTTGNVTSTETAAVTGAGGTLTISKTTGNVVASRTGDATADVSITGTTGTVALTHTHSTAADATGGIITVNGGTTISVTQATTALNKTFTNGTVNVTGGATTTAVTVNNAVTATAKADVAGATVGAVTIADANYTKSPAGTITSATVTGFSTLTINDAALTTLSVTGGTGNIIIDNTPTAAVVGPPAVPIQPTATTLGLTINGQTSGTLDDADIYTTLNVTTTGADSKLANITTGAVTGLTVAGTKVLTLTSATGLSALKTATVSGSAGLKADLSGATVTSVSTAATTGASAVTIDGTKATFTGGAGADTVTVITGASKALSLAGGDDTLVLGTTLSAVPTVTLDGGAGTDTLNIDAGKAATFSGDTKFAGLVTNFERLVLTGATGAQNVEVTVLGNFNHVTVDEVTTVAGANLTLTSLPSGGTLVLAKNDSTFVANVTNTAFAAGQSDTINLVLNDATGIARNYGTVNAANVENFVITTTDGKTGADGTLPDTLSLGTSTGKSVTVSGNGGLNLTSTSTALTNVDASGITLGGFKWASGDLANNAIVKGTTAGSNDVDVSGIVTLDKVITYTGGTGIDKVTLAANTLAATVTGHNINLGGGTTDNTVSGGANGANTVTSTAGTTAAGVDTGTDMVTLGNGNNIVTLGAGKNVFVGGNGNNTYTGGAGQDQVTVGTGANTITLGAGATDAVTFNGNPIGVNSYSTITDAHKGMTITVAAAGTETFGAKISLASTAQFTDYANAVVAQGGALTNAAAGHFGWFTFTELIGGVSQTNTYIVESLHAGTGANPAFIAGTDFIVKLTGVVDLTGAFTADSNVVTLMV